jgi:hypothetical protein
MDTKLQYIDHKKKAQELFDLWHQGDNSNFGFWWRFLHGNHRIAALDAKVRLSSNGPEISFSNTIFLTGNFIGKASEILQDIFRGCNCRIGEGAFTIIVTSSKNEKILKIEFGIENIKLWVNPNDKINYILAFRFIEAVRDYCPEPKDD